MSVIAISPDPSVTHRRSMRCPRTAATNALDHDADIAKLQEWLRHANIAKTRNYNHAK
jgi:site-specific recombinase XerD